MEPNDLPLVCLPVGLDAKAAAQMLEFLEAFTEAFERHYGSLIQQYYRDSRQREDPLAARRHHSEPPF